MSKINCFLMRGGTSKAGCFLADQLPQDLETQDQLLCRIFGSNDSSGRQIDGIGGGASTTSKAMIISKAKGENCVNYTFAQVDTRKMSVDRKGNCGNISSAVGPFAIEMGLIEDITEPVTTVTIFNTNTEKKIIAHVPVKQGKVIYQGDFSISGVPGTAAKIRLDFLHPGGAVTKKLLPGGETKQIIKGDLFGEIEVSLVDAANPLVFVRAEDLGLAGKELPEKIDKDNTLLERLLAIREEAAVVAGIAKNSDEAKCIPAVPKFCIVAKAQDYMTLSGEQVLAKECDLVVRMFSMGKVHPALAVTGGICIAVAAKLPETLVNELINNISEGELRIGHPAGVFSVNAKVNKVDNIYQAEYGSVYRTAKVLLRGEIDLSDYEQ